MDISTTDVASTISLFDVHGLAIVPDVLDAGSLRIVRDEIDRMIAEDIARGTQVRGFSYDPDDKNIRIVDMVPRSAAIRALAEHPLALALVTHALGKDFRLSNFSGNRTNPGSGAMGMHADQGFLPAPWPPYAMTINIGWALDDFTVENGGTRYIEGSHTRDHGPEWGAHYPEAKAVTCRAGAMFAMDGRTWHQTGANVTNDSSRTGLFAYYVRPFIVTQRPWPELVSVDERDDLTPGLARMLGFDVARATTNLASRAS